MATDLHLVFSPDVRPVVNFFWPEELRAWVKAWAGPQRKCHQEMVATGFDVSAWQLITNWWPLDTTGGLWKLITIRSGGKSTFRMIDSLRMPSEPVAAFRAEQLGSNWCWNNKIKVIIIKLGLNCYKNNTIFTIFVGRSSAWVAIPQVSHIGLTGRTPDRVLYLPGSIAKMSSSAKSSTNCNPLQLHSWWYSVPPWTGLYCIAFC